MKHRRSLLSISVLFLLVCLIVVGLKLLFPRETSAKGSRTMKVLLGNSKTVPYSDRAPTQVLETFLSLVQGQLVYSTGSFDIEPGLISNWIYDYETSTYLLTLKENTRFHNGRLADSSDLEFSIVRHLLGKYGSWFRPFFGNIEGVERVDDSTKYRSGLVAGIKVVDSRRISIKLKHPNPSFLHSLARSSFSLVAREALKPNLTDWIDFPVGAGNYRVLAVNKTSGNVELEKVSSQHSGPERISIYMDGSSDDIDVSLPGIFGSATTPVMLRQPSGVTLVTFNYELPLARNASFRSMLRNAINTELIAYEKLELRPLPELLPKRFWGRTTMTNKSLMETIDLKEPIKIGVYDSGSNSKNFFSFLDGLKTQWQQAGIQIEYIVKNEKYDDSKTDECVAEISTLGADIMDPLILFNIFRDGSPMKKAVPPRDREFESLALRASDSALKSEREDTVSSLSNHFDRQNYVIPLFERFGSLAINSETVKSVGEQNGSLILYIDRLELK